VAYPGYEELTVFAAAGAVTERIRFVSNILVAPARSSAELAKQAATVQQLTGGRLTLGLGIGGRPDDFLLTGRDVHQRGRAFDQQLADLRRAFAGEPLVEGSLPVVPDAATSSVPILIGGTSDAAIRRTVEFGIGWTAGGTPPQMAAPFVARVRAAWQDAGREGAPRIVALNYFGLGDTEDRSRGYLLDYYGFLGPEMAGMIADGAHRSPQAVKDVIAAFAEIGVDELILDPTVGDPAQVDLLAEVAFG
jgi:alkanesulfonate monooxygenase SsuD/methylene tetrahydromethanopterin reductase-like flavin-dependent oxidoreductase (luciferase family)